MVVQGDHHVIVEPNHNLDIDDNDEQIVVSELPEETSITLNEILNFNENLLKIQENYSNEKFKRIHLEALMPVFEDYFSFDLRYYPEVELHDRKGYLGPTAKLEVCGILEEDLTNLQKYIDYLLNLK